MEGKGYCAMLVFLSFFAMWSAGTVCANMVPDPLPVGKEATDFCKDEIAWALVASLISFVIAVIMAILYLFCDSIASKIECGVAIFLCLVWFCGVFVCTFKTPFAEACAIGMKTPGSTYNLTVNTTTGLTVDTEWYYSSTGNGWISFWLCLACSVGYMVDTVTFLKKFTESSSEGNAEATLLGVVAFGSLTVMVQGAFDCGNEDDGSTECTNAQGYAVAVGCISLVVSLVCGLVPPLKPCRKYIMPVLALFLFAGIATLTFAYREECGPVTDANGNPTRSCPANTDSGVFAKPGNGFFGIWMATFACFALTYALWTPEEESMADLAKDPRVHVGMIAVASFFEFWAAGILCEWKTALDINDVNQCVDEYAYAVAIGIISFVVSVVMIVLYLCAKGVAEKVQPVVAVFLFLWWVAGFIVVTFEAPFPSACGTSPAVTGYQTSGAASNRGGGTANGYISVWIAFFASIMYMMSIPQVQGACSGISSKSGEDGMMLMPLALGSLIVMAQGCFDCNKSEYGPSVDCSNSGTAWAVAAGCISFILAVLMMLVGALADFKKYLFAFLTFWWFVCIAVLTFSYADNDDLKYGIFADAGNGFFASWLAFMTSIAGAYSYFVAPIGVADDDAGAAEGGEAHDGEKGEDDTEKAPDCEDPAAEGDAPGVQPEDVDPEVSPEPPADN